MEDSSDTKEMKPFGVRSISLTDTAYQRLERMIVTLELEPGGAIYESELATHLGIGRTPVREALLRLNQEGLVTILRHKGVIVTDVNPVKNLKVIEVRRELERLVARRAAEQINEKTRARFIEIAAQLKAAADNNDYRLFLQYDDALHRLISATAANEFATIALRITHGQSRRFWFMYYRDSGEIADTAILHFDLALAVASGNATKAGEASDRLLDEAERESHAIIFSSNRRYKPK